MSAVFGKKKQSQSSVSSPFFTETPFSFSEGTKLTLDPSIRALQDEQLGKFGNLSGRLGAQSGMLFQDVLGLRNKFRDNSSGFFQAVTNPVRQSAAESLGAAERNVGLRGLGGSSFGQQTIDNARFLGARNVADAEALARMQQLTAEAGLNDQASSMLMREIVTQAQLLGVPLEVAMQRLQQELASFGLGTQSQGTAKGSGFSLGFGFNDKGKVAGIF